MPAAGNPSAPESCRGRAATASADGAVPLETLKRRPDFLAAARARRQIMPGFILQARRRQPDENATPATIRVGFTCSKKLGNAVTRNRAKRRLRAAVREVLPYAGRPGWDYVLVGRPGVTVALPFGALTADLHAALARMAAPPRRSAGTGHGRESGQAVSTGAETGS